MDFSSSGITYAFLIIPLFFAVMVIIQGVEKASRRETEGYVALGFGGVFLLLILVAYIFFIR